MAWSLNVEQLPDLLTAFCEAEDRIAPAFRCAVNPFRLHVGQPEIDQFRPGKDTWRIGWWLYLPARCDPFEVFKCELDLGECGGDREVKGWIDVRRYVGKGVTADEDLWESATHPVGSPAEAAAAVRRVSAELVQQLGRLDLRPYLAGKTAEPGTPADRGGM